MAGFTARDGGGADPPGGLLQSRKSWRSEQLSEGHTAAGMDQPTPST
eukprot:CAMPEP_0184310070 /NCGR_PEP_ID=MMETSP1049-20130417/23247_1 /TAXON_ID=77928 /ORGANISM="Proteomonas sulcata, Strain CCMP704" /LENGTH=46 /DNA_ID= /DNA_START= /DNA_END= /DNA_ORIENTATION=